MTTKEYWLIDITEKHKFRLIDRLTAFSITQAKTEFESRNKVYGKGKIFIIAKTERFLE